MWFWHDLYIQDTNDLNKTYYIYSRILERTNLCLLFFNLTIQNDFCHMILHSIWFQSSFFSHSVAAPRRERTWRWSRHQPDVRNGLDKSGYIIQTMVIQDGYAKWNKTMFIGYNSDIFRYLLNESHINNYCMSHHHWHHFCLVRGVFF